MSGSYPASPGFNSAAVSVDQLVHQAKSASGKVQTRLLGAHKTVISLQYGPLTRDEFAGLDAFIMSQRGRDGVFTFLMPDKAKPLGAVTGSPVLYDNYKAGLDTIVLDKMPPGVSAAFVAADIINFGGYTKVHKTAFTADSQPENVRLLEDGSTRLLEDGSTRLMEDANTVTLTISPVLYKSLNKGTAVNYENVTYTVRLKSDTQSVKVEGVNKYMKQVELIEYLG